MAPETSSLLCRHLGLRRNRQYVIYDDYYALFATRFWWVCRYYGLDNLSILDGSWRGWLAEGRPVSSYLEAPPPGCALDIAPQANQLIGLEELRQSYPEPGIQLWDTRRA